MSTATTATGSFPSPYEIVTPPTEKLAVIGDDLGMDVKMGLMGGSQTALVRSGTTGMIELAAIPERARPDAVIDTVADLLDEL